MKLMKKLWIPLLLGLLLMATVVGLANARPNARPLGQARRVLAVPTGACIPRRSSESWMHFAHYVQCDSGMCEFICAVNFPAAGEQAVGAVNVKRLTMYAYDNNSGAGEDAKAWLHKAYAPTGGLATMANVTTSGTSAADPEVLTDTTINNNPVYRTQGPVLWLDIGGTSIKVYGFFVHYTW